MDRKNEHKKTAKPKKTRRRKIRKPQSRTKTATKKSPGRPPKSRSTKKTPSTATKLTALAESILLKIEYGLIAWLIFFIPANMALHFYEAYARIYGFTIDYLIPKLYLSDLVIGALFFLWLVRHRTRLFTITTPSNLFSTTKVLSYFLIVTLIVSSVQSSYPLSAYWYVLKLVEMAFLFVYLRDMLTLDKIRKPLLITLLFQSFVGLIHWIQKSSFLGYWFLGETALKNNSIIAKTGITGEIRPLPYGTTSHPNVLGGFLAVGLLILLITHAEAPRKKASKWLTKEVILPLVKHILLITPIVTTLLLTQSVSAVIVLIAGLVLLRFKRVHWFNAVAIVAILVSVGLAAAPFIESTSVSRRIQLAKISQEMIQTHSWLGVGPNNFTARMSDFGTVTATTRFLQPVHNIYLLWLSEAGLIATCLVLLIMISFIKSRPLSFSHRLIPLIAVLVIGMADHYPLTLQTGQLLTVLCLAVAFGASKSGNERSR